MVQNQTTLGQEAIPQSHDSLLGSHPGKKRKKKRQKMVPVKPDSQCENFKHNYTLDLYFFTSFLCELLSIITDTSF